MGKIRAETEAVISLIRQTKRFVNKENDLLLSLKSNYARIESEWNDLQYKQFQNALNDNIKCVQSVTSLAEEQIRILGIKLKQLQNYLDSDIDQYSDAYGIDYRINNLVNDYVNDLRLNSEVPDTLSDIDLKVSCIKIRAVEDNIALRSQFKLIKNQLIKEWEIIHGRPWPVYERDILNEDGQTIKRKGWKYDAHHIHPLAMGGENIATNITPFRYDLHSDHLGIHSYGSPYDVLDRTLRGNTYE